MLQLKLLKNLRPPSSYVVEQVDLPCPRQYDTNPGCFSIPAIWLSLSALPPSLSLILSSSLSLPLSHSPTLFPSLSRSFSSLSLPLSVILSPPSLELPEHASLPACVALKRTMVTWCEQRSATFTLKQILSGTFFVTTDVHNTTKTKTEFLSIQFVKRKWAQKGIEI